MLEIESDREMSVFLHAILFYFLSCNFTTVSTLCINDGKEKDTLNVVIGVKFIVKLIIFQIL